MRPEVKRHFDRAAKLVVEAHTSPCGCSSEDDCTHCRGTGVIVPHSNSPVVLADLLIGCVVAIAAARDDDDSELMNDIITWARRYVQPNIDASGNVETELQRLASRAAEGRALIERSKEPSEPVTLDSMRKRLGVKPDSA